MPTGQDIPEQLVQSLRATAARAAEVAGDGCSLVFAAGPGADALQDGTPLRAAAGVPDAAIARQAATELADAVSDALRCSGPSSHPTPACLAAQMDGSVTLLPLAWGGRPLGVLAVASTRAFDQRASHAVTQLAASASLQLDHARLSAEVESLRPQSRGAGTGAPGKAGGEDELLRLSEQLFAQDIELLRNTEKLGKIEKLKNDFIEKMSRELRTPLNNIIEAIIAVIANENERLSEPSLSGLRNALDEGTAFQRTLQNILDLWRIKQNELPLEVQVVNFAEVVDEAIFSVQDTLGSKPVAIEKEYARPLPKIRTDLAKVNQVLFLLLDNAAKFTNDGRITIAPRIEGGQLVCSVRDTGIGICPDDQQLIFDEFFQVDDMASGGYRGAGLGLTLVRDLLVLLDGEISLTSEAGRGTEIAFRLPVQVL